jgi:chromosome segregation ATPase
MKLIPSYQEFVYDMPLQGKISPELAEKLAADFEEIDSLNEGFLDSIKNTLSKTFLGSLSYINMIDKARASILKDQKDLLSKQYSYEDEMSSLRNSVKQAQTSVGSTNTDTIKKTISNKENEYKTYVNMVKKRIEKVEDAIDKIIEGNKRRSEYYDAGKSQDELEIAEFEYKIAKARTKSDPKEIKELESKVEDAKKQAEDAKKEIEKAAKAAKANKENKGGGSKKSQTGSGKGSLSSQIDKTEKLIKKVKDEIAVLKRKQIGLEKKGKDLDKTDKMELESKNTLKSELEKLLNDASFAITGVDKGESSEKAKELENKTKDAEKSAENMAKNVDKITKPN